jgi:hypothetical protein
VQADLAWNELVASLKQQAFEATQTANKARLHFVRLFDWFADGRLAVCHVQACSSVFRHVQGMCKRVQGMFSSVLFAFTSPPHPDTFTPYFWVDDVLLSSTFLSFSPSVSLRCCGGIADVDIVDVAMPLSTLASIVR